eukprot:3011924-Prymnesium_polylepis.1
MPSSSKDFSSLSKQFVGAETDDTRSIAIGDVDSTNGKDIVATNFGVSTKEYLNTGTSVFTSVVPIDVGSGAGNGDSAAIQPASAAALGDLDSNGFLDIIAGAKMYLNPGVNAA